MKRQARTFVISLKPDLAADIVDAFAKVNGELSKEVINLGLEASEDDPGLRGVDYFIGLLVADHESFAPDSWAFHPGSRPRLAWEMNAYQDGDDLVVKHYGGRSSDQANSFASAVLRAYADDEPSLLEIDAVMGFGEADEHTPKADEPLYYPTPSYCCYSAGRRGV